MDIRHLIRIIDDCARDGTDAYGLAVRIATEVEADAAQRIVIAARGLGFAVEIREGGTVDEAVAAVAASSAGG